MSEIPAKYESQYQHLLEELTAIVAETKFNMEMELVKGKWMLGRTIVEYGPKIEYGKAVVSKLSEDLGLSEREIYYCIKFAKKFPNLMEPGTDNFKIEEIPVEGKTVHWSKIKKKALTESSRSKNCDHNKTKIVHTKRKVCKNCGEVLDTQRF